MRTGLKIVVGILVVVVVGAAAAYVYIDQIAKRAVERGSEYALGVDTSVETAHVKIFDGQLVLADVKVSNPEGYNAPHFLRLGEGDVVVTLGSLRHQPVHVPHLSLSRVDLNLQKSGSGANYQVVLDNLRKLQQGQPPADAKRFIIDRLDIRNVDVHVDMLGLGDAARIDVPIQDIRLTGVGAEDGRGVTISELSGLIVQAVLASAVQAGASLIPDDIQADLRGRLEALVDLDRFTKEIDLGQLEKHAQELGIPKDVTDKARETIDEAAEKLEDTLKNVGKDKPRDN